MKTQMTVLALGATTLAVVAGCTPAEPKTVEAGSFGQPVLSQTLDPATRHLPKVITKPSPAVTPTASSSPTSSTSSPTSSTTSSTSSSKKAKIVSFKLVQKPKCPEGTAVFRAPAVPAIIKWKITGATGAALSVDDPTNTPGTYGPEPLSGTETFAFGCNGPVGSTEKHTYAIYTVGGGKQRSMTIVATAKVLDNGKS